MQLVDDAPVANPQPIAIASLEFAHIVVTGVGVSGDCLDLLHHPLLPVHRKPGKSFGKRPCGDHLVHQSNVTISNIESQPGNPVPSLFSSHFSCTAITDTQSQSRNNSPAVQASKTASVSRDGPKIRPKIIFGGFFDNLKTEDKQ